MRVLPLLLGSIALAACTDKPESTSQTPAPAPVVSSAPTVAVAASGASAAPSAVGPGAPASAPEKIAVQHLLVTYKGAKDTPKGTTRTKAEARTRAEAAREKALAGTDFSAVVAEYTEDPGSKDRQGSLGTITREKVVKPFADAAFALPVDAIGPVVESPYGFHVIKRNQ